jgi:hypothetical protein
VTHSIFIATSKDMSDASGIVFHPEVDMLYLDATYAEDSLHKNRNR